MAVKKSRGAAVPVSKTPVAGLQPASASVASVQETAGHLEHTDDRLDRLIEVVGALWTDPYARPHCRKSGGLPRQGCDCPICVADVKLKAIVAPPVTMTG